MTINLTLNIEPKALPRARHSAKDNIVRSYYKRDTLKTFDTYTDMLNQAFKRLDIETRHNIRGMVEKPPERLGIALYVVFYMPIPKSWSKKKKEEMNGRPHLFKPDNSNILKLIEDRANGILYDDDKRIYKHHLEKIYSYEPRIEATLEYNIV